MHVRERERDRALMSGWTAVNCIQKYSIEPTPNSHGSLCVKGLSKQDTPGKCFPERIQAILILDLKRLFGREMASVEKVICYDCWVRDD